MREEFEKLGIDLKGRTSGQYKTRCPKCYDSRKNKKDPSLSVNISEGIFNCHNCGWHGTVKRNESLKRQVYTVPKKNNSMVSDGTLSYFESRGLSKATVMRYGISECIIGGEVWINFNYYRDGHLVNIKYRKRDEKEFKLTSGAELIFYGLDFIKDSKKAIITEGEIVAMSFYEAGFSYVVSVPNGASRGNQKLEYLDNCSEAFDDKEQIVIAVDNDEPGRALSEELARRLGKERCYLFNYPDDAKDANEILKGAGINGLRAVMGYISPWPLEGVTTVMDLEDKIDDLYFNGFPKGLKLGYPSLDRLITWRPGEFVVITGIPGSGKSEFINQVVILLIKHHSFKWGIFSAENQPMEFHFTKLAEKLLNMSFTAQHEFDRMSYENLFEAKKVLNDNAFFINMDQENLTLDGLLSKAKELILRKGINGLLIDPWNYVEHRIPPGYTETQYISEALTKIATFAKVNRVLIIICAHPTKIQKDSNGSYKIPTLYDIAGSANWFNKADNGVTVYRDFETNIVYIFVQKIRNSFTGQIGKCSFKRDPVTGTYHEYEN